MKFEAEFVLNGLEGVDLRETLEQSKFLMIKGKILNNESEAYRIAVAEKLRGNNLVPFAAISSFKVSFCADSLPVIMVQGVLLDDVSWDRKDIQTVKIGNLSYSHWCKSFNYGSV